MYLYRRCREVLSEWKREATGGNIRHCAASYHFSDSDGVLTICTDIPGWFIGKAGVLVNKYSGKLQDIEPKI